MKAIKRTPFCWGLMACGLMIFAACSDNARQYSPDPEDDPADVGEGVDDTGEEEEASEDPNEPVMCGSNRDCSGGEVCRAGLCRQFCSSEDPCTGPLTICDEAQGICVGCLSNQDCGQGLRCDTDAQACVEVACSEDTDCRGGFRCLEGLCEPIDDLICQPDSQRCEGNTIQSCNPDGTIETPEACEEDQVCVEDGDSARCQPQICEPLEVGCVDEQSAFVCDEAGIRRDRLECREDQSCFEGICTDRVCEPSSLSCQGDELVTCDALGLMETRVTCSQTPGCENSPLGCVCREADCVLRICEPGALSCNGDDSQTCSQDGTEFIPEPCGEEQICVAGICLASECEPNAIECVQDVLVTCNDIGTQRSEHDCQTESAFCDSRGEEALCIPWVCEPGTPSCEGNTATRCNGSGSGLVPEGTDCAEQAQTCIGGQCVSECTPGQSVCEGDTVLLCQDDRITWLEQPCDGDQFCEDGACRAQICEPDQPACDGERATLCNERGSGFVQGGDDCTARDLGCLEGECAETCEPGARWCEEREIVICNDDGFSLERIECAEGFECLEGVCTSPGGLSLNENTEQIRVSVTLNGESLAGNCPSTPGRAELYDVPYYRLFTNQTANERYVATIQCDDEQGAWFDLPSDFNPGLYTVHIRTAHLPLIQNYWFHEQLITPDEPLVLDEHAEQIRVSVTLNGESLAGNCPSTPGRAELYDVLYYRLFTNQTANERYVATIQCDDEQGAWFDLPSDFNPGLYTVHIRTAHLPLIQNYWFHERLITPDEPLVLDEHTEQIRVSVTLNGESLAGNCPSTPGRAELYDVPYYRLFTNQTARERYVATIQCDDEQGAWFDLPSEFNPGLYTVHIHTAHLPLIQNYWFHEKEIVPR